jgi:membrane fusion protein
VDQTTAGGANVDLAVLDALARQKALLAERLATQEQFAASERLRLQAQIDGIRAEVAQFEAQIATQAERVRLAASRVSSTAELRARGVASDAEYKQRRESQLEQQGIHGALVQDLIARRSQLAAVHQALGQLPIATAEKLQQLRNELLETEQRIAEIEGRRGYVLRAPAAGLVSALQATVGRIADPRQPQLSLLPEDGALQAELFVPTRAAGFLRPGQEVRILYDAFPYQRFGTYRGRLLQVSQTVLMGADISAPIMLQEAAYRATVELERQSVDAGGSPMRLQPDMLLRADIVLDRRPLLVWLLDPLLRARIS